MTKKHFECGSFVFVKKDGELIRGMLDQYSFQEYWAGKELKTTSEYRVSRLNTENKLTVFTVLEDGSEKLVISHDDLVKVGAKVTTSSARLTKDAVLASTCLNKVPPNKELQATIVSLVAGSTVPIIMLDESEKFGILYDDMGVMVREDLESLNIPNIHNRRFCCISSDALSFNVDSDSSIQTRKKTMSSNKIVETLKGDAKEAAYRVAGTQITNGVKLGVVKLFESKGGKSDQMEMLRGLLDSELGDSMIALILGYGLTYAPGLKDDPRVQKLSAEFRVNGMAVAGNAVMGAAMESILPVLSSALQALPAEETSKSRISEHSEEEEEEEVVPPARASKRAGG